jgi:hypothetical protein
MICSSSSSSLSLSLLVHECCFFFPLSFSSVVSCDLHKLGELNMYLQSLVISEGRGIGFLHPLLVFSQTGKARTIAVTEKIRGQYQRKN